MRIAAVLLAAGSSRRFGAENKLLTTIDGVPLVRRTALALSRLDFADIVAVAGHDAARITAALEGLAVRVVENPEHARGMGTSIARGVAALSPGTRGAMIVPADMPGLDALRLGELLGTFTALGGARAVHAADASGAQRPPVVWPARYFGDLAELDGPGGGKMLLPRDAVAVRFSGPAALTDIDTIEDFARWQADRGS